MPDQANQTTMLLRAWCEGNDEAREELVPLVYEELSKLARYHMKNEAAHHTLQPTELVHEAFLKLNDANVDWQDRSHFCSVASHAMRRVLVDHARARKAAKRGGGALRVTLSAEQADNESAIEDVLTLDMALKGLAELDERKCQIIEMTYFGGLQQDEIGSLLNLSRSTVHRELKFSRAWLRRELEHPS